MVTEDDTLQVTVVLRHVVKIGQPLITLLEALENVYE